MINIKVLVGSYHHIRRIHALFAHFHIKRHLQQNCLASCFLVCCKFGIQIWRKFSGWLAAEVFCGPFSEISRADRQFRHPERMGQQNPGGPCCKISGGLLEKNIDTDVWWCLMFVLRIHGTHLTPILQVVHSIGNFHTIHTVHVGSRVAIV